MRSILARSIAARAICSCVAVASSGAEASSVWGELVARHAAGIPNSRYTHAVRFGEHQADAITLVHSRDAGAMLQVLAFDSRTRTFGTVELVPLRSDCGSGGWKVLPVAISSTKEAEGIAISCSSNGSMQIIRGWPPALDLSTFVGNGYVQFVADLDRDGGLEAAIYRTSPFPHRLVAVELRTGAEEWHFEGSFVDSLGALGQLDNDPAWELVMSDFASDGVVLDGASGAVEFEYAGGFDYRILSGNIDEDALDEFLVISGSMVTAFDSGPVRPVWQDDGPTSFGYLDDALLDVDGDEIDELWIREGSILKAQSLPERTDLRELDLGFGAGRWLAMDVDGDSSPDILTMPSHSAPFVTSRDVSTGAVTSRTPAMTARPEWIEIADLDGDSDNEVALGWTNESSAASSQSVFLQVFDERTGHVHSRRVLEDFGEETREVLAFGLGQFDDDAALEIAAMVRTRGDRDRTIQVRDAATWELQWTGRVADVGYITNFSTISSPDGEFDLVVGFVTGTNDVGAVVLDGRTGSEEWRTLVHPGSALAPTIIPSDVDADGESELTLASEDGIWSYGSDGEFEQSISLSSLDAVHDASSRTLLVLRPFGQAATVFDLATLQIRGTLDLSRDDGALGCVVSVAPRTAMAVYSDLFARMIDLESLEVFDIELPFEPALHPWLYQGHACASLPSSTSSHGVLAVATDYGYARYRLFAEDVVFGGLGGGFESPSP